MQNQKHWNSIKTNLSTTPPNPPQPLCSLLTSCLLFSYRTTVDILDRFTWVVTNKIMFQKYYNDGSGVYLASFSMWDVIFSHVKFYSFGTSFGLWIGSCNYPTFSSKKFIASKTVPIESYDSGARILIW